ncbi:hypothetical protein TWF281_010183 [Arthrobotrys megalospora]
MHPCKIETLALRLTRPTGQGVPIGAIKTWQPNCGRLQYSFPKSELRQFVEEELDDDSVRNLLFPTCDCHKYTPVASVANPRFYARTREQGKLFPLLPLKKLILDSYLSSFVWLIENKIPWCILYLLHNQTKDVINSSAEDSLKRFSLELPDTHQNMRAGSEESQYYEIQSDIGGLKCSLYIDRISCQSTGDVLGVPELYHCLRDSHPRYFMKDLFSQALHKFEDHCSLPILADAQPHPSNGRGEGSIFLMFTDINDKNMLGLREWCTVNEAMKICLQAPSRSILAPLSAFVWGERFCIIYPRALCDLHSYLTKEYHGAHTVWKKSSRLSSVGLWRELAKVATTLELLHDKGHCHLDLTLSNLLVMGNGDLVISDFGEMGTKSSYTNWMREIGIQESNLRALGERMTGNPSARPLREEFTSQTPQNQSKEYEELREAFQKSYDLYSFGQVCLLAATYTKLMPESKLIKCLNEQHDTNEGTIYSCAFFQWSEPGGESPSRRSLVNKPIIGKLLDDLATENFPFMFRGGIKYTRKTKKIKYDKISDIIRRLLSPEMNTRALQGSGLGDQLLQCLQQPPIVPSTNRSVAPPSQFYTLSSTHTPPSTELRVLNDSSDPFLSELMQTHMGLALKRSETPRTPKTSGKPFPKNKSNKTGNRFTYARVWMSVRQYLSHPYRRDLVAR